MNRRIAAVLPLIAAVSAASADGVVTWRWFVDNPVVTPDNPAVTLQLMMSWEPYHKGFAGSLFHITNTQGGETGTILSHQGIEILGTFTDQDGVLRPDNSITDVEFFQLPKFFNPQYWDPFEAEPVYTFVWTTADFTPRHIVYDQTVEYARIYVDDFGDHLEYESDTAPFSWQVVPAPGAWLAPAIFAVCALSSRRR